MQTPSTCNLYRKSANSRPAIQSLLYLTTQQTARSQSKITANTVYVKYILVLNQTSEIPGCSPPDLNVFYLEDVCPRVFAEAVSLSSLAAQAPQWGGKLSGFD